MCPNCSVQDDPWGGDISDRYSFVEDRLIYNDATLGGYLACRECGSFFFFQCRQQGERRAWLWQLLPVAAIGSEQDDEHLLKFDLHQSARERNCVLIEIIESDSGDGVTLRGRDPSLKSEGSLYAATEQIVEPERNQG